MAIDWHYWRDWRLFIDCTTRQTWTLSAHQSTGHHWQHRTRVDNTLDIPKVVIKISKYSNDLWDFKNWERNQIKHKKWVNLSARVGHASRATKKCTVNALHSTLVGHRFSRVRHQWARVRLKRFSAHNWRIDALLRHRCCKWLPIPISVSLFAS